MAVLMFRPVPVECLPPNKYILEFQTEIGIEEYFVHVDKRPTIEVVERIPYKSITGGVPTKYNWLPMTIQVRSIDKFENSKLYEWIKLYDQPPIGKITLSIKQVDPIGYICERWILQNCFIVYHNNRFDNLEELKFEIVFDNAFLTS